MIQHEQGTQTDTLRTEDDTGILEGIALGIDDLNNITIETEDNNNEDDPLVNGTVN